MEYAIKLGEKNVGQARMEREGLYYRISCRCSLQEKGVYRILVSCGSKQENLGICVPVAEGFGIDTKIPVKRLGEGKPEFQLLPRQEQPKGIFAPVYPEEPFSYMARLKGAYLARQADRLGIVIPE